jgi:hypothetical protein
MCLIGSYLNQVHAEELQALLKLYEKNGYFDELISLLESGLGKRLSPAASTRQHY